MDFLLLYRRLLHLVSSPSGFWSQVKEEQLPSSKVRRYCLMPVILLIALASFTGTWLFSYNSLSVVYPLLKGLEYFLIFFISVELVSFLLAEIAGYMLKIRLSGELYKLITYSLMPFMLVMIITRIFSSLLFLNLLGLYGILILWTGIDILIGGDKLFRIRLTALISVAILVFYMGIRWMISSLIEGLYFEIFG